MAGAGGAAAIAAAKRGNANNASGPSKAMAAALERSFSESSDRNSSKATPFPRGADQDGGAMVATRSGRFSAMSVEELKVEEHRGVARVVHGRFFSNFVTLTILIGAVQMGAQADISDPSWNPVWDVFEHFFTTVFTMEMVLKLYVLRGDYFRDQWNLLDCLISWISIIGAWVIPLYFVVFSGAGEADASASLDVLKVFRLLRLFRILKIMKAVPELRMVIEGIAASLRAMFWVCLLLFIVIYMFSIYCVEILGREGAGFPGYVPTTESIYTSKMMQNFNSFEYFGNIPRAMLSIFGVTLLTEYDVIRPVWETHQFSIPLFIFLIFLTSFGIVNVIIGVIVERTTSSMAEMEKEITHNEHLEAQANIVRLSDVVWARTDADGSGTVSREELGECAGSADIVRLFKALDWPKGWTLDDLHTMLDGDGGGTLTRDEFCDGMHRLIFGNDFQKSCMNMLIAGQIKQVSNEIKITTSEELALVRKTMADIQRTLATVLAEVRSLAGPPAPADLREPNKELARPGEHGIVVNALRNAVDSEFRRADADTWKPFADEIEGAPILESPGRMPREHLAARVRRPEAARAPDGADGAAASTWRQQSTGKLRGAGGGAHVGGASVQQLRPQGWSCAANSPIDYCSAEDIPSHAPSQV